MYPGHYTKIINVFLCSFYFNYSSVDQNFRAIR